MTGPDGKAVGKIYNPAIGKYDVAITAGASYATKRQEAAESMLALTQVYPQLMQLAGDLMVKNLDWPGADVLADRLKRTVPPEILGEENEALPPQVEQVMNQASNTIEQLQQQVGMLQQALLDKQREQAIDQQEADVKAFDAETKRIKETSQMMTPQQIQAMIVETIKGLSTSPDISPAPKAGANLPLDFSGL